MTHHLHKILVICHLNRSACYSQKKLLNCPLFGLKRKKRFWWFPYFLHLKERHAPPWVTTPQNFKNRPSGYCQKPTVILLRIIFFLPEKVIFWRHKFCIYSVSSQNSVSPVCSVVIKLVGILPICITLIYFTHSNCCIQEDCQKRRAGKICRDIMGYLTKRRYIYFIK